MRQAGRITEWNDAKGFGFVTPVDGGRRVFVHIKAFQVAGRRPLVGDLISYDTATDAQGRVNAASVRFAGQRKVPASAAGKRNAGPRRPPRRIPRLAIGASFLLTAVVLMLVGVVPAVLPLLYLLVSCASYLMYGFDKEIAGKAGWRRTPESTLHLLDLAGGWPGGLVAQHVARHKTAKASFQRGFWITVVVNLVLFGGLWRSGIAATWTEWLLG
jgi:uncharacterized membrane protein YsdA (DUF1294 family)/cold shock CspA family protein